MDLGDIAREIADGEYSGNVTQTKAEVIDGATAAKALQEQGSDPEFFRLTEDGNDTDGDDTDGEDEND
jgi:hypothetical protein